MRRGLFLFLFLVQLAANFLAALLVAHVVGSFAWWKCFDREVVKCRQYPPGSAEYSFCRYYAIGRCGEEASAPAAISLAFSAIFFSHTLFNK